MKFIITENRINQIIDKHIRKSFKDVYDVTFRHKNKILGSTEGQPTIRVTEIIIIINNIDNDKTVGYLRNLSGEIYKSVNNFFSLGLHQYGSKWDIIFKQIKISNIE